MWVSFGWFKSWKLHPPLSLLPSLHIKCFLPELNCPRYYKEYQDNSEIPLKNLKIYRKLYFYACYMIGKKQILSFKIYKKERLLSARGPGKISRRRGTWPGTLHKTRKTRGDGEERCRVRGLRVTRAQGRKSTEQIQEGQGRGARNLVLPKGSRRKQG